MRSGTLSTVTTTWHRGDARGPIINCATTDDYSYEIGVRSVQLPTDLVVADDGDLGVLGVALLPRNRVVGIHDSG